MADDSPEGKQSNRQKKVAGRAKRRRFVQGTRAYLHAVTNSVARRAAETGDQDCRQKGNRAKE